MALPPARHPAIALILVAVLTAILAWVVLTITADTRERERQDALAPFYLPPDPLPDVPPGTILRSQPLGVQVQGGRALRILYMSERGDGQPRAASGMLFIPTRRASGGDRPVVAWAHGTIGLGDTCAPSRIANPTGNIPWVEGMLARGWVVAATDYAGLGTPGPSGYLIEAEEGRDVINSVRAAREAPGSGAGDRWISWGHSQGGHSALAAGSLAAGYAPELDLLGVAAAAPAAELRLLMDAEWNTANAWVIGSDVAGTWPDFYPELRRDQVLTTNGEIHWQSMLEKCITQAAYTAIFRQDVLGQDFFRVSPGRVPAWQRRVAQNTPRPLPASLPLFLAQSTTDTVVLPGTTAALVANWCDAGTRISTTWIADTPHMTTAIVVAPSAVQWMDQVFAGRQVPDDCAQPTPVAPSSPQAG